MDASSEEGIDERRQSGALCENDKETEKDEDKKDWSKPPLLPYLHIQPKLSKDNQLGMFEKSRFAHACLVSLRGRKIVD